LSSLLLHNGMRLTSERTAALRDVRKQPSIILATCVCMFSRSELSEVEQLAKITFP